MSKPKVYIVTINHNGEKDTMEFIESLRASSYPNYSLIIVDNSSDCRSTDLLFQYISSFENNVYLAKENEIDDIKIAEAPISFISAQNNGFAAANNVALRHLVSSKLQSDYVLIINNDVILHKDAILHLVNRYEEELDNKIGIVAPVIYYHGSEKVWIAGGYFYKPLGLLKGFYKNKQNVQQIPEKINFLTGCAWLIRIDRLKKIGLLDETFFMYGEDLDYSLKAKELNLKLFVEKEASIWHKIGGSSDGDLSAFSAYWMMFGRIRNIRKHSGSVGKYLALVFLFISRLLVFPIYIVKGRTNLVRCQMKAIYNGLAAK